MVRKHGHSLVESRLLEARLHLRQGARAQVPLAQPRSTRDILVE